jgi:tRNA pseudouridine55 synthase
MRPRRGSTDLAGIIAIDKPVGLTSHDVVAALRTATGERRIGHAGTLDPMATGLLLVLIGRATRLEQYFVGHDKRYEARIVFGSATDTLDAEGHVTAEAAVPPTVSESDFARKILDGFLGVQDQMPPAYSAIKRCGVSAHRVARAGGTPDLQARTVEVYAAELLHADAETLSWTVLFEVSKGTYIRSLARDIGLAAGTVAHLGALRRIRIGSLDVREATVLPDAVVAAETGAIESLMIDPVPLLGLPTLYVDAALVADGRAVPAPDGETAEGGRVALIDGETLLGVYRRRGDTLVADSAFVPGIAR